MFFFFFFFGVIAAPTKYITTVPPHTKGGLESNSPLSASLSPWPLNDNLPTACTFDGYGILVSVHGGLVAIPCD